jgi:hypothetical protein
MSRLKSAKAATADTVNGLRGFEQPDQRLNSQANPQSPRRQVTRTRPHRNHVEARSRDSRLWPTVRWHPGRAGANTTHPARGESHGTIMQFAILRALLRWVARHPNTPPRRQFQFRPGVSTPWNSFASYARSAKSNLKPAKGEPGINIARNTKEYA